MTNKASISKTEQFVTLEGVVAEVYPEMKYLVEVDFKGIKHKVKCYVSGKMRTRFIVIKKGDKVRIQISLYDIDSGIITYRLNQRGEEIV
jgi:translation initiation factor IF-1